MPNFSYAWRLPPLPKEWWMWLKDIAGPEGFECGKSTVVLAGLMAIREMREKDPGHAKQLISEARRLY